MFKRFAHRALEAGAKRISGEFILHRIRWETSVETRSDDGYKINAAHTPYYTRKFIAEFPHLREFFELRQGRWMGFANG
jgi:hypothetical protein